MSTFEANVPVNGQTEGSFAIHIITANAGPILIPVLPTTGQQWPPKTT